MIPITRRLQAPVRLRAGSRRGTAMIVTIICMVLVSAIGFSLVRFAVAAQQQTERQGWRMQSAWLAESALWQATERIRRDVDFTADDWTIEEIGPSKLSGHVDVQVTTNDDNEQQRTIRISADFPADDVDRVRTSRTLTITLPDDNPAPTN